MTASMPLVALRTQCARHSAILHGLTAAQWRAPTRCAPWDTAALNAHITATIGRVTAMLDAPEPPEATVTAAGYYRPDERFAPEADAERRSSAAVTAAAADGPALAADFDAIWKTVVDRCRDVPPDRRVTTRHGDPMTLEDFLVTRVVEVAVHGMDLCDAAGIPRQVTEPAQSVLVELLLGPDGRERLTGLALGPVAFIAKATGRDPMSDAERDRAAALGITWLTLA